MKLTLIFITCFLFFTSAAKAQNNETTGWFFLTHKQKLVKKIFLLADVQLRSADQLDYLTTLLLRTAVSYQFNKKHSAALGYAYKGDWEKENGKKEYEVENRIYEQYLLSLKLKRTEFTGRLRQEQRFTMQDDERKFSQRSRVFVAAQIPLLADKEFKKGLYLNLQNEVFMNVQNKQVINNHFFDQNRLFGSFGYRWSEKIDTEIGYMYWRQQEEQEKLTTHVFQLMITTEL